MDRYHRIHKHPNIGCLICITVLNHIILERGPRSFNVFTTFFFAHRGLLWRAGPPLFLVSEARVMLFQSCSWLLAQGWTSDPNKANDAQSKHVYWDFWETGTLSIFHWSLEMWGYEAESSVSHCATNGCSLLGKFSYQAEGKWRNREAWVFEHGLSL